MCVLVDADQPAVDPENAVESFSSPTAAAPRKLSGSAKKKKPQTLEGFLTSIKMDHFIEPLKEKLNCTTIKKVRHADSAACSPTQRHRHGC